MIGFIGSGKVAVSFGSYAKDLQIPVAGYYDLDPNKAIEAAAIVGALNFRQIEDLLVECSVIFISTSDDQIEIAARQLAAITTGKKIAVGHFSGAHSSQLLRKQLPDSCLCFSMHPMQSFSGTETGQKFLKETYLTIEGEPEALQAIEWITDTLPNPVLTIEPEHKTVYHASGVMASNYVTTVIAEALYCLNHIGISEEAGMKMLRPLVEGTVAQAFSAGPRRSLTGPIARGDASTVSAHLDALRSLGSQKADLYRELAKATLQLAAEELLSDGNKIKKIDTLLRGDTNDKKNDELVQRS